MKTYQSKTISLRYDDEQDRLQWLAPYAGGGQVVLWITRNLLARILLQFSQWLDKRSDLVQADSKKAKIQTSSEKKSLQHFTHEAAQHQVAAVKTKQVNTKKIINNFLLYGVTITPLHNNMIKLALYDKAKQWAVLYILTVAEMHKLLREMINLSNTAHWNVADPWIDVTTSFEKKKKLMH